ncbi:MAG: pilus assembly protein [Candidatus Dadabacteria bacterium]|nr:MAG: pilus assembly protein [Candidatus Dadabacteria bacterium]
MFSAATRTTRSPQAGGQQGSVLLELAITVPFLLFIIFFALEASRYLGQVYLARQISFDLARNIYQRCYKKPQSQSCLKVGLNETSQWSVPEAGDLGVRVVFWRYDPLYNKVVMASSLSTPGAVTRLGVMAGNGRRTQQRQIGIKSGGIPVVSRDVIVPGNKAVEDLAKQQGGLVTAEVTVKYKPELALIKNLSNWFGGIYAISVF